MPQGIVIKIWNIKEGSQNRSGADQISDSIDYITNSEKCDGKIEKSELSVSITEFAAVPNSWSAGNGTITIRAYDQGTGIDRTILNRTSMVDGATSTVATWYHGGIVDEVTDIYTETNEGVFFYTVQVWDRAGNVQTKISPLIYLDHSNPVIYGIGTTVTDWTNVAPVIHVTATDFLYGTVFTGSGLDKLEVWDDAGNVVASGVTEVTYTLADSYEGIRSVLFYKVSKDDKTAIYTDRTYALFDTLDTHSSFELYYDVNAVDEYMDSYLIVVKDFAGNVTKKKLICQKSLLLFYFLGCYNAGKSQ